MSRLVTRPRIVAIVIAVMAVVIVGVSVALGISTTRTGKAVKAMKVVTEDSNESTVSTAWTDLAGMSLTMAVPSGEQGLFLATFAAAANSGTNVCRVQMLISGANGGVMPPGEVPFHGSGTNSIQFLAGPYPAGQYTLKVQFAGQVGGGVCALQQRSLSILRSKV